MKKTKHHTIPSYYLKNFIDHNGNLFVLDIKSKKIFTAKLNKISS